MLKPIICSALLCAAQVASAETFYQPTLQAEVFYSNMRVEVSGVMVDQNGQGRVLRKPKGSGAGIRLAALLTDGVEATGEASRHSLDINSPQDRAKLQYDLDQYRVGLRWIANAKNSDYPVYIAAGLEYAHFRTDAEIRFENGVTEAQAGENPAADADTRANDIPFDQRSEDFGIGHLRLGYRSPRTHLYGDLGLGLSDDGNVFETLGGIAYTFTSGLSAFGEYRSSLLKRDAEEKVRYNDLRLGLGLAF